MSSLIPGHRLVLVRFLHVALIGAACMTTSASAAPQIITVDFSGTMFINEDNGFLAAAGITNGDELVGRFVYDTSTPPHLQGTDTAQYWPLEYSFSIGNGKLSYIWPTGCCGSGLTIRDNFSSLGDMFMTKFSGELIDTASGNSNSLSSTNGWIADSTGTAWSGTSLPDFETLSRFIDRSTNTGYSSFARMQGNGITFTVQDFNWVAGVGDTPPISNAGADQAIRAGEVAFLNGGSSFDDNTPTADLLYAWSFSSQPATSTTSLLLANTTTPSFVADVAGTYTVQLVVTDSLGQASEPDYVIISSDNLAPTANAGSDKLIIVGTTVVLDGSGSTDPENDPLSFSWTLDSVPTGSSASLTGPNLSTASLTPDVEGLYVATLAVADQLGPGISDSVTVTAVSSQQYAEAQIVEATATVAQLSSAQVTSVGNQNALTELLAQAAMVGQQGNNVDKSVKKLNDAISRTDGCVLRGEPDGQGAPGGAGANLRDWVTDCQSQFVLYAQLKAALDALTQP